VNFNHLMEKNARFNCNGRGQECYWAPTGPGRATAGDNVCLTMYCKKCRRREDIFLSRTQYKIQENLIRKEVGDV
jgi:hypothetical protein